MKDEVFSECIKSSHEKTAIANKLREALIKAENKNKIKKTDTRPTEFDDMEKSLSWIQEALDLKREMVQVTPSDWFYAEMGPLTKELQFKLPLTYEFCGGVFWVIKSEFDQWMKDVEIHFKKRIRVESSFNNKFSEDNTGLIWTYKLLNLEMIT